MNFRTVICCICVLTAICATSARGAERIKLGEKVKRTMEGEPKSVFGNPGLGVHYQSEFIIALKAGQSISAQSIVTGKDRLVTLAVADPKGVMIKYAPRERKSVEMLIEEVSATGDYKILVLSDLIGEFTLKIVTVGEEEGIEVLERRIDQLKKELGELEDKLKRAKAKRD